MTTATTELLMKNVIRKTAPAVRRQQRLPTVSVPQKDGHGDINEQSAIRGDDISSCVAFKKPHLPPFFGPDVVLYLFEMFNKDGEDK